MVRLVVLAVTVFVGSLLATTTYVSPCGAIPDATIGGPGVLNCSIHVTDLGMVPNGNVLTISLIGLQHEASGDLVATLTHYAEDQSTVIGAVQYLFSRIGQSVSQPFGSDAQFGDPLAGTGDNYLFNSTYSGDLWAVAALLGAAQAIPGLAQNGSGQYFPTGPGGTPTALSSAFGAQPLAGYWQLSISDMAAGPGTGPAGNLTGFSLIFGADVPEPSTLWLAAVALALLGIRARRFPSDSSRRA